MRTLALLALAAGATSCASIDTADISHDALAAPGVAYQGVRRGLAAPQLQAVGTPAALTGGQQQTMPQPEPAVYEAGQPNSLWRTGSRSFFNDQRASRIGDIITVEIEIDDSAELSNSSNRQRSASTSAGVSNFFGLETAVGQVLNNAFDPSNMISADADSSHNGQGAINREEKISSPSRP